MQINVRKLNGTLEPFDERKLRSSLSNAGASDETINVIMEKVKKIVFNGIRTSVLFDFIFKEFNRIQPKVSPKYNLKNALTMLGKEGFVFEDFISRLLECKGYSTELDVQVQGQFVTHEIDVAAKKDGEKMMIECKYHKLPHLGCRIQTALYVYARFLDVKKTFNSAMLATNTKFSSQVIDYSNGVGLKLLGWHYPINDSLEVNIERYKLYPLSVLSSINEKMFLRCAENGVLLVKELAGLPLHRAAAVLGVSNNAAQKILHQCFELLS